MKTNNITRCKLKQNENRNLENLIIKYNTFFFEMLVVFFHSFNVNTKNKNAPILMTKNFHDSKQFHYKALRMKK